MDRLTTMELAINLLDDVRTRLAGHSLVKGIDRLPKGHVRIETATLYPDGDSIDVFVSADPPPSGGYLLTDFGQTTAWLLDAQADGESEEFRRISDVVRVYGVERRGGALEYPLDTLDQFPEGIIRLSQACLDISQLAGRALAPGPAGR